MELSEEQERRKFFYETAPMYQAAAGEWENEQDKIHLESQLPARMQEILNAIAEVCDTLEYDGSMMYDELLDKELLRLICKKIREKCTWEEELPDDITQALLIKEFEQRRCRHRRCSSWW